MLDVQSHEALFIGDLWMKLFGLLKVLLNGLAYMVMPWLLHSMFLLSPYLFLS